MQGNLFNAFPSDHAQEEVRDLLTLPGTRIERIVSNGQASPPGFWYDQPQTEWVLLVEGQAWLRFEDEPQPRHLRAGDWLTIAPHRRHRVEATDLAGPTIWLAVHIEASQPR